MIMIFYHPNLSQYIHVPLLLTGDDSSLSETTSVGPVHLCFLTGVPISLSEVVPSLKAQYCRSGSQHKPTQLNLPGKTIIALVIFAFGAAVTITVTRRISAIRYMN